MEGIPSNELPRLAREGWRIVDVRAPVEFLDGALPGSLNLPIMNDDERARVGTEYKLKGSAAAIALGMSLVHGTVREERTRAWLAALGSSERSLITCFRGGLRSRYSQDWCREAGLERPRLREGYKGARAELRAAVESSGELVVVAGPTGSGKSEILRALCRRCAVLDLEAFAEHRGSAFGGDLALQPSQATFENRIGWEILRQGEARYRLIEDESRRIGRLALPVSLFARIRASPVVLIDESPAARSVRIHGEYVADAQAQGRNPFPGFRASVMKIEKRLGGARAKELLADLALAEQNPADLPQNLVWIAKLLEWYYDPLYLGSLAKREARILFRGSKEAVQAWLADFNG